MLTANGVLLYGEHAVTFYLPRGRKQAHIRVCEFTCNPLVALVIESDPFDPDLLCIPPHVWG
ncbi:MAG TPA: hypothetical protein VF585_07355 [Chthoniobacterales bacterium]|jgi:hypothetical protein